MRIFSHKETSSSPRNKGRFYTTIKTQNPQKIRYAQFYPNSGTLDL